MQGAKHWCSNRAIIVQKTNLKESHKSKDGQRFISLKERKTTFLNINLGPFWIFHHEQYKNIKRILNFSVSESQFAQLLPPRFHHTDSTDILLAWRLRPPWFSRVSWTTHLFPLRFPRFLEGSTTARHLSVLESLCQCFPWMSSPTCPLAYQPLTWKPGPSRTLSIFQTFIVNIVNTFFLTTFERLEQEGRPCDTFSSKACISVGMGVH